MNNNQLLLDQVKQSLQGHANVLLALSGGVDSMVLLHLLVVLRQQQPNLTLRALYIHHGLSRNASEWGVFCRAICERWQVPFELVKVNVDAQASGVEAGARIARYQIFEQKLAKDEALLTAQHLDDQCETFLLALKRGSGPAGLSSMPESQPFAASVQIRPLLNVSRLQIEHYAENNQLEWVNDESNEDDSYDRNFLRLRVLPVIQRRWPNFPQAVARSAELCAEQEQLLDELLASQLQQIVADDGSISIPLLQAMSDIKRQALIRRWFAGHNHSMPSRQQLQNLWREVALAREDAEPGLKLGNKVVRRYKQRLYLTDVMRDLNHIELFWSGDPALELPDGLGLLSLTDNSRKAAQVIRAPEPAESVSVRFSARGEFYIQGRKHSRSIKKLWQEFAVPPWRRDRIPLIYFNDVLISAVGVFTTRDGQCVDGRPCWLIEWQKKQAE